MAYACSSVTVTSRPCASHLALLSAHRRFALVMELVPCFASESMPLLEASISYSGVLIAHNETCNIHAEEVCDHEVLEEGSKCGHRCQVCHILVHQMLVSTQANSSKQACDWSLQGQQLLQSYCAWHKVGVHTYAQCRVETKLEHVSLDARMYTVQLNYSMWCVACIFG